ncbi:UDP-3-O-(3-hydroxymyristoyl)glucosamine N-acyltransferase [Blautia sp. JLR.GB0024]|uniref:UDP-3-O-(3-hydroxymyristoyl)glucosamine N-acyltransferase n=1 Tax=Blautia sp. JLR.GB0024 TaxID=3123295 RepID=UPI0030060910
MEKRFFSVNINKYDSDRDYVLTRAASLNKPANNSVMFCTKEHLSEAVSLNNVNNCLVFWPEGEEIPAELAKKHVFVFVENPRQAYAMFFVDNDITYLPKPCEYEVINGAYIAKDAQIGEGTVIFPGAYIGDEVVTGKNCYIDTGVKLLGRVILGDNVVIRANTVVGADGLTTMRKADGSSATIPQFGGVILEDKVQIGANTVIARGAIDDTVVHTDSKVDSSCFISHNVQIGAHSFIVGETIMFGSSSTGERAYISGNSTIREGHHVGNKSLVGMGSVVVKNVPDGAIVKGNPAK